VSEEKRREEKKRKEKKERKKETGNGSVLGVVDKTLRRKKNYLKNGKRGCSLGDKPRVHS